MQGMAAWEQTPVDASHIVDAHRARVNGIVRRLYARRASHPKLAGAYQVRGLVRWDANL